MKSLVIKLNSGLIVSDHHADLLNAANERCRKDAWETARRFSDHEKVMIGCHDIPMMTSEEGYIHFTFTFQYVPFYDAERD